MRGDGALKRRKKREAVPGAAARPAAAQLRNWEKHPFGTLGEQVLSGEIKDAKTIAAALKAKLLLEL